ncbi:hypothetical protein D9V32_15550 [Mycetocola tolaasinivorans]|uniref:Uncharacterized protein n=1 Tax=Mycetocola tolaasinivorans TaxID=76635 RepID=A0A3L6ZWN3_9MICO|nr:hypothetical protein [Mycetocola tolaasinivorans]RLP72307.1 hypothetical protein D9V32_15550 [Mycetocola tolaasinivorans]
MKVLVNIRDTGEVSVQQVVPLKNGAHALHERSRWVPVGRIRETGKRWTWSCGDMRGEAKTRDGAIAELLDSAGMIQVTLDDTIPDLLAGL